MCMRVCVQALAEESYAKEMSRTRKQFVYRNIRVSLGEQCCVGGRLTVLEGGGGGLASIAYGLDSRLSQCTLAHRVAGWP